MNNAKLISGISLLSFLIILAITGPEISKAMFPNVNALEIGTYPRYEPASIKHPIGTDAGGVDAFAMVLNSIWPSLVIGLLAGITATLLGVMVGFTAGYVGKSVDTVLRTITDMVLVFPVLPLFLIMGTYITHWDVFKLSLLLGVFGWPFTARVIRAQVLSLRERPYIDLVKLSGENTFEIIFLELLPGLLPYVGFSLAMSTVGAMFTEAALQLIGLGAQNLSTLGTMIGHGLSRGVIGIGLYGQMVVPAGILILLFLSLNIINMGLEEVFNPRLRTKIDVK